MQAVRLKTKTVHPCDFSINEISPEIFFDHRKEDRGDSPLRSCQTVCQKISCQFLRIQILPCQFLTPVLPSRSPTQCDTDLRLSLSPQSSISLQHQSENFYFSCARHWDGSDILSTVNTGTPSPNCATKHCIARRIKWTIFRSNRSQSVLFRCKTFPYCHAHKIILILGETSIFWGRGIFFHSLHGVASENLPRTEFTAPPPETPLLPLAPCHPWGSRLWHSNPSVVSIAVKNNVVNLNVISLENFGSHISSQRTGWTKDILSTVVVKINRKVVKSCLYRLKHCWISFDRTSEKGCSSYPWRQFCRTYSSSIWHLQKQTAQTRIRKENTAKISQPSTIIANIINKMSKTVSPPPELFSWALDPFPSLMSTNVSCTIWIIGRQKAWNQQCCCHKSHFSDKFKAKCKCEHAI